MELLRWLGRALLLVTISVAAALWVLLATLHTTLLQRNVVYGWFAQSGAYSHIVDSVVRLQQSNSDSAVSQTALQQAVQKTLNPAFIQHVTEVGLGGIYDWIEGKTAGISFTIPLQDKRQDFVQAVAAQLKPQLAALQACKAPARFDASNPTCIPPGQSADQIAQYSANQILDGSIFLTKPLTAESLGVQTPTNALKALPVYYKYMPYLLFGLPLLVLACAVIFVLLGAHKIRSIMHVSIHLLLSVAGFTLFGVLLWYIGDKANLNAAGDAAQNTLLTTVIQPLLHLALPAIGVQMAFASGAVVAASVASWIISGVIAHKLKKRAAATITTARVPKALPPVPGSPASTA